MRRAFQSAPARRCVNRQANRMSSVAWRAVAWHGRMYTVRFRRTRLGKKLHRLGPPRIAWPRIESPRERAGCFLAPFPSACCRKTRKGRAMSMSQAIKHARAVRQRLRHPRNAVADHGIDLEARTRADRDRARTASARRRRAAARHRHAVASVCSELSGRADGPPTLSVRTIQRTVCRHYGVSLTDLLSSRPHPGVGAAALRRRVAQPQAYNAFAAGDRPAVRRSRPHHHTARRAADRRTAPESMRRCRRSSMRSSQRCSRPARDARSCDAAASRG